MAVGNRNDRGLRPAVSGGMRAIGPGIRTSSTAETAANMIREKHKVQEERVRSTFIMEQQRYGHMAMELSCPVEQGQGTTPAGRTWPDLGTRLVLGLACNRPYLIKETRGEEPGFRWKLGLGSTLAMASFL
ncbi:uncharacterized protein LOC116256996 [Nymphaea colorata]|uniref:uncharacterized protein LOC116256996 n=1 Tax=Nymphaea colorata TaxID=210225 RepID=UPI00129DFE6E|nr:uncharacterized protein LOC116256996 [Nymphaea colorata]